SYTPCVGSSRANDCGGGAGVRVYNPRPGSGSCVWRLADADFSCHCGYRGLLAPAAGSLGPRALSAPLHTWGVEPLRVLFRAGAHAAHAWPRFGTARSVDRPDRGSDDPAGSHERNRGLNVRAAILLAPRSLARDRRLESAWPSLPLVPPTVACGDSRR